MEDVIDDALGRDAADLVVPKLLECCGLLDEAVGTVVAHASPAAAERFKRQIAKVMVSIGWDILEQEIYAFYPDLRPYDLSSEDDA